MGDLSNFERGQIIGVCSAGASVTKTSTLSGTSRVTFSKVYVGVLKSWEDYISKEEKWVKINIDRKRSLYIERDCFEKSQNYCNIGDRRTEYSS
jgi:hypothetical protein